MLYCSLSGKGGDRQVKTCGSVRTLYVFGDCCVTSRGPMVMARIYISSVVSEKREEGRQQERKGVDTPTAANAQGGCPLQDTAEPRHLPCSSSPLASWHRDGGGTSSRGRASGWRHSQNPSRCCIPRFASRPPAHSWWSTVGGGGQRGQRLRAAFSDIPTTPYSQDFSALESHLIARRAFYKTTSAGVPPQTN